MNKGNSSEDSSERDLGPKDKLHGIWDNISKSFVPFCWGIAGKRLSMEASKMSEASVC